MVREVKKMRERGKEFSQGIAKIKKILENRNVSFKFHTQYYPDTLKRKRGDRHGHCFEYPPG
jgi:hypothetical protein